MELLSLPIIFFIVFISAYFYILLFHPRKPKPGFKFYPFVGALPGFLQNRHRFLDWSTEVLAKCPTNTSVFRRPGKVHGILTANPLNVEHMLKANFVNYPKGPRFVALLEDFLGKGIFNSDGELWKIQRKTASYEFNTRSLRNFVMENVTTETHSRLIPLLRAAALSNKVLDMQDILERFAFDNICKLAFNVDPGCLGGDGTSGGEFMQAFEEAAALSSGRFMYALPSLHLIKKHLNVGSEKRLRKSIRTVHEFADNIIRTRLEERSSTEKLDQDLLSRFIGNSENSPEFLRDIVISFILAGRDTTSSALTWFFWLLSSRPDVEEKILRELRKIREEIGRKSKNDIIYSFDELREMHYLQAAISEAMRLYPPVPVDTKACLQDDVLPDGTFIGKDWFITYHTYAMGRMENIWGKDCLEYNPERWIEKNGVCKQESPFRFPVFHGGPRMCLGKDMAYIQMKSIAASVMERFRLQVLLPEDEKHPQQSLSLTLRMKGGLHVRVMERSTV